MKITPTNITEKQKEIILKLAKGYSPEQLGKTLIGINTKKYKQLKSISQLTFRDARKLINELHRTSNGAHENL